MIRKAYWGVLASILVALAFATGCSSTSATPPPPQVTTVTIPTADPAGQNAVIDSQYGVPLTVLVATNGVPVPGVTVTFSAPQSSGSNATGTFSSSGTNSMSTTTDANGLATSSTFDTSTPPKQKTPFTASHFSGTFIVIASAVGTTSTAQFSMFNTLQPEPISVAGGSPQSTSAGEQFNSQLSVTVKDSGGTVVGQGLPVTFTNASGDGTFADTSTSTTTAITNPSGVATAAPFIAGAGVTGLSQYTVTATTIDGDPNSATFTLSNTIVPAAITAAGSSTPQTAAVNTPFAPLTVTVWDGTTPTPVGVPGAVVTFSAPSFTVDMNGVISTSSGTFPGGNASVSVWTDASGVATAPTFTANGLASPTATGATSPTPYNVSATVVVKAGSTLSVNFVLTNQ